jgi:hypothetical protein
MAAEAVELSRTRYVAEVLQQGGQQIGSSGETSGSRRTLNALFSFWSGLVFDSFYLLFDDTVKKRQFNFIF